MDISDPFTSNVVSGIIAGIVILVISVIGGLGYKFLKDRSNVKKLLNNAHELYDKEKFPEALMQYLEILNKSSDKIEPYTLGQIYSNIGGCYLQDKSLRKNSEKILEGINYLDKALKKFDIREYPLKHAAYRFLNFIDKKLLFRKCLQNIFDYQNFGYFKLLSIFGLHSLIFQFAGTKNDLAIAYCKMAEIRNSSENYEKAIDEYQDALKIYTFEHFPVDHMRTTENLITTYLQLAKYKETKLNLERARVISSKLSENIEKRPELFDIKKDSPEYAKTFFGAGNFLMALFDRNNFKKERLIFLKSAITCFKSSLNVFSVEEYSYDFAMVQNNLGIAYNSLAAFVDPTINSEKAEECFLNALSIRTENRYPLEFGQTTHNLANSYYTLAIISPDIETKMKYFFLSLENSEKSLRIRNIETYPVDYAETQFNRALTYISLSDHQNKKQNLMIANSFLKEAEKIFKKEKYPEKNAAIELYFEIIKKKMEE